MRVHPKGWMDEAGLDEAGLADCVSTMWSRHPGGLLIKPGLLVCMGDLT